MEGCCCFATKFVVTLVSLFLGFKIVKHFIKSHLEKKKFERWANTKKDVIVFHTIETGLTLPQLSPFALKLETFFRMAGLKYEIDTKDYMGPRGKTPWITLNGKHMGDSQLIIEHLQRKYNKNFGAKYSEEQKAIGTAMRILLDEHFYWGLVIWRYLISFETIVKIRKLPFILKHLGKYLAPIFIRPMAEAQGLGRHDWEDVKEFMERDLRALSKFLGNKKFLLGDEPYEDDCAIFGELSQAMWGAPGSPYEKLLNGELKNLRDYCLRMKEKFFPDWDKLLEAAAKN